MAVYKHIYEDYINMWNSWSYPFTGTIINSELEKALRFNFVIGDRGVIYEVHANLSVEDCGCGYLGFRTVVVENSKLQLHRSHILRIPTLYFYSDVDAVNTTKKYIENMIRKSIITETIQPEDFYE